MSSSVASMEGFSWIKVRTASCRSTHRVSDIFGIAVLLASGCNFRMFSQKASERFAEPRSKVMIRETRVKAGPIGRIFDELTRVRLRQCAAQCTYTAAGWCSLMMAWTPALESLGAVRFDIWKVEVEVQGPIQSAVWSPAKKILEWAR